MHYSIKHPLMDCCDTYRTRAIHNFTLAMSRRFKVTQSLEVIYKALYGYDWYKQPYKKLEKAAKLASDKKNYKDHPYLAPYELTRKEYNMFLGYLKDGNTYISRHFSTFGKAQDLSRGEAKILWRIEKALGKKYLKAHYKELTESMATVCDITEAYNKGFYDIDLMKELIEITCDMRKRLGHTECAFSRALSTVTYIYLRENDPTAGIEWSFRKVDKVRTLADAWKEAKELDICYDAHYVRGNYTIPKNFIGTMKRLNKETTDKHTAREILSELYNCEYDWRHHFELKGNNLN